MRRRRADPKADTPKGDTLKSDGAIPSQAELKKRLSPLQYAVTQEGATEPPFHNPTGIIISRGSMSISSRANRSSARRISSIRGRVGRALPNRSCGRMCARSESRTARPRCARARRTRIWATNSTMDRRRLIFAIVWTRPLCALSLRLSSRRKDTGSLRESLSKGAVREAINFLIGVESVRCWTASLLDRAGSE